MAGRDVVVFGEAMAMFVPVEDLPLERAETYRRFVAGTEFNVAVGLSRLGYRVGWISRVGADPLGTYLTDEARRHGIDTSQWPWMGRGPPGSSSRARERTRTSSTSGLAPPRARWRRVAPTWTTSGARGCCT